MKRWQGLTRRDGTPYAADIRRAVQSSLFNNSSQSPIFVKLPETDQNTWGLAARGVRLHNSALVVNKLTPGTFVSAESASA